MSGANTSTAVLGDILLTSSELHLFRGWELGDGKGGVQDNGEELWRCLGSREICLEL